MTLSRKRLAALVASVLAALLVLAGQPPSPRQDDPLADAFARAAAAHDVPRDLLVALAYAETHLDGHGGEPSASGGYGVMHLVSNPTTHSLEKAAELTGLPVADAARRRRAPTSSAAPPCCAPYADELGLDAAARKDPGRWYEAVAKYGNASTAELARLYADTVYELPRARPPRRRDVTVAPQEVTADRGSLRPDARDLNAAAAGRRLPARRLGARQLRQLRRLQPPVELRDRPDRHPRDPGLLRRARSPGSRTRPPRSRPHYVVRSSDGAVTQMVREKDIAWHAGNWSYNTRSIGIEHEGYVDNASWFTDAMYRSSAALTRNICRQVRHPQGPHPHHRPQPRCPAPTHTDPGPNWNWTTYMNYVTGGGGTPSWTTTVDNATAGQFTASANWGTSTYSSQRYGADYRFADPVAASDAGLVPGDHPQRGHLPRGGLVSG